MSRNLSCMQTHCWIFFKLVKWFHAEAVLSSVIWRCRVIFVGFDQVGSLDPYLSCFVKRLHHSNISRAIARPHLCIMRALMPPVVSMLYCHYQQSLKPFNPPKRQEKQTGEERGAGGMRAVELKLISRPLTKLSDTGGAKGQ